MGVKEVLKKIAYGKRYSSETYIDYLRRIGVKIGEDCTIYVPSKTLIDEQYPWMITIGNHVRITEGVKILTHDYSWSVLKLYEGVSVLKFFKVSHAIPHISFGLFSCGTTNRAAAKPPVCKLQKSNQYYQASK